MKQGFNPYLPPWEYVPDGEPYVFNDRVYVYGSHDRFNGYAYCLNDYICWSAPVTDLTDWRYEGVIYRKTDDPENPDGEMCLYAPDVVRGEDGRYYLYYVYDQLPVVSVAVCDEPAGKYEFLGYVHYEDGTRLGEAEDDEAQFDPGVLMENGKVYLYCGFCMWGNKERHGAMVTVLDKDMLTIIEKPKFVVPSDSYSKGTGFEGYEYFEAASIRKVRDQYYFIYSSVQQHELCYAVSNSPTENFKYGGVIVSNCDRNIDTYKPSNKPMFYGGNNHGSIVEIAGNWYVFYHRHTNGTNYARQGCIEPIKILNDGTIPQVEMTSSGACGKPLRGEGEYPSYIACNLLCNKEAVYTAPPGEWMDGCFPKITQEGKDGDQIPGYIANLRDGVIAGFKYFDCKDIESVSVKVRGRCWDANIAVMTAWDGEELGRIPITYSNEWKEYTQNIIIPDGVQAIYFKYIGYNNCDMLSFTLHKKMR